MKFEEVISGTVHSSLGSYAQFVAPYTLKLAPTTFAHLGAKVFKVTISDGTLKSSTNLYVDIINTPPYFLD
jgi:hypothetical protein